MYTVLIVEDENILREGLLNAISWSEMGFQVVACASSGEEGLELFNRFKPDVVLTDIKMYEFSGLDLLKAVKTSDPQKEVVLLSGYEDFNYAKTGIESGAFSYIVKLNLFEEIGAVFEKLFAVLTDRKEQNQKLMDMKDWRDSQSLISRLRGETLLEESHTELCYGVLVVWQPQQISIHDLQQNFNSRYANSQKQLRCRWLQMSPNYVVVLFHSDQSAEVKERMVAYASYLERWLRENQPALYALGLGRIVDELQLDVAYKQAVKSVDHIRKHMRSGLADYSELFENRVERTAQVDMDQLKKLIDLNKSVPFIRMMQRYIDECMEDQHCDVSDVRACFQELIFHIRKHILEFNIPLDLSLHPERLSALLYEMDSMHDIRDEILPKFERLCEIIGQYRRNEHAGDIQKAIAYIDNHYYTDITMNESAQYAFMSPPYFSAKFKETVGHNFTDYVKLKRLIRAAELLVDTDYKIREIASHVGYQDEKYFSRVFKSHYHISPVRYREIHKEVME